MTSRAGTIWDTRKSDSPEPILAGRLNGESNRERTSAMDKATAEAGSVTSPTHLEHGKARA